MAAGRRGSSSKTGGEKGAASSGPLISADSSSAKSPAAAAASVSAAGGRATSSSSGGVSLGFSGSNFTHRLADLGRSVLSKLTPKPSQSNFVAAGTLTPEEFVDAGDLLVHRFPTWQWCGAPPRRANSWLPPEKQFLLTKGVACHKRVKDIELALSAQDKGGAVPDLSALDLSAIVEDEKDSAAVGSERYFVRQAPDADIVSTRTYDLSVTYDTYFQTPRLWLFGYDENGVPLRPNEIFEDVFSDYVSKTVTVDPHPVTGIPTASIHPCKHDLAVLVLLKFIASVIPTIEYDYTMDVDMGLCSPEP